MRKVEFFDIALRDGEQMPGVNPSIKEKVTIVRRFEKRGIASIEAGFSVANPDSFETVRQTSAAMATTVVLGLARSAKSDIDACYKTLKDAKYPQCHAFTATSPIRRECKPKKTKEEILDIIEEHVACTRNKFGVVELSPEDATRTGLDRLLQVVQTAVDTGAIYINIPDTVGSTVPGEYNNILKYLIENIKSDREIIFSPHYHDDPGMATIDVLVTIKNGAGHVEGTINGIGERIENVALEGIAVTPNIREDYYQATSDIILNGTVNASELISRFSGISIPKDKAVVGGNAFSHESSIHQGGVLKNPLTYEIITPELVGVKRNPFPLGKSSDRHAFVEKLKELELALEESEITMLFGKFKKLADEKHEIIDADIGVLAAGTEIENPEGLHFGDLKLTSNADDTVTAEVLMVNTDGEEVEVIVNGKDSVEAIYNVADRFFNRTVRLLSYTMDIVADGIDSQARVSVSIENVDIGTISNAPGIDSGVLKAGAITYVNANVFVQRGNAGETGKAIPFRDVPTN